MNQRVRSALVVLLTALSLLAVACGSDTSVGEGVQVEEDDGSGVLGALRDTTTTAPPRLVEDDGATVTTAPTATAPTTAPPTTQPAPRFTIRVLQESPYFDPVQAAVRTGTIVEFVNTDSVEREVVINDGQWRSGMIAPGGTAEYPANTPGTYSLSESTRPYATGGALRVG